MINPRNHPRSRHRRAALALAAGAALALAAALPGCGDSDETQASASTADRTTARLQSFNITTVALGELESRNAIEIRNKVEARTNIVEIVPEGTIVKKGDLLVKLNSDTLVNEIQEETLRVESAKADLIAAENALQIQESDNESKLREALLTVELAKLSLQQWKDGDVVTRQQALLLEKERSERELTRLKDRVDRSEKLHAQEFLSKDELERDRLAYIQAQADYKQAILDEQVYKDFEYPKEEKQKNSDVEQAEAEVLRVRLNNDKELASKRAAANNKREQLKVLEQKLAKYREQLEATEIVAPSDGLVVYATSMSRGRDRFQSVGALQVGREVFNNEMLISLPDTSVMQASVQVHESLAGRIRPGMPATIKIDALPGLAFSGKVDSVGIMAEQNNWRDPNLREYTVKVTLDAQQSAAQLKPSMRAEARIEIGKVENVLAVPLQAVFSDNAVRFVYVQEGARFAKHPVSVGRRSDTLAEIKAGITAGQVVLLREPDPGEVIDRPWDKAALEAAGYVIGDNGQPFPKAPEGGPMQGMPGGMPPGAGGNGPGNAGSGNNAPGNSAPGNGERRHGPRNGEGRPGRPSDTPGDKPADDKSTNDKSTNGKDAKPGDGTTPADQTSDAKKADASKPNADQPGTDQPGADHPRDAKPADAPAHGATPQK